MYGLWHNCCCDFWHRYWAGFCFSTISQPSKRGSPRKEEQVLRFSVFYAINYCCSAAIFSRNFCLNSTQVTHLLRITRWQNNMLWRKTKQIRPDSLIHVLLHFFSLQCGKSLFLLGKLHLSTFKSTSVWHKPSSCVTDSWTVLCPCDRLTALLFRRVCIN